MREAGFGRVEEGDVTAVAWFEGVEDMAEKLTGTLRMMVGQAWSEGEKERMEGGLLEVLREWEGRGTESGLRFKEGGWVGVEMSAFTVVARK